jgi:hypothetical protein
MQITARVDGDRAVAVRLDQMPERVHGRLSRTIKSLTARLLALVQAREPKRTGQLESETVERFYETRDAIRGVVTIAASQRTEYGKAAALEYGAHGMVSVREHKRLGHDWAGHPVEQIVDPYTRHANIPEFRYERGALEEMRGDISADLTAALEGL